MALAQMGHPTLCLDCDVGLRNLDIAMAMTDSAVMDFTDVMAGRCTLEEAAARHPRQKNLYLLTAPARSGAAEIDREAFRALFPEIQTRFRYCLVDAPAGLGAGFRLALAGADRIFKLMDEKPEVDEGYVELVNAVRGPGGELTESKERTGLWAWKHYHKADNTTTYVELKGDVVFDHVDFGYNDDKMILHDVELYAKPGQKIAFVGATGAGKTTITNLINRFYDIQDGKIRYDAINVNKIKKADLRRSLGIVLQDTHLFTGTVMENIRYGKMDATDAEVKKAAVLANAHGFIRRLPDGYDTMLHGDGANLSQGQRQLLAIARAAIADPPVLILDEATSSIDTRTEKLVQQGMDALMKGRTNFVIAHRLSTVKNSDCIIVLEQGRIIEKGTHDQLIEQKGKYYQLYTGNAVTS